MITRREFSKTLAVYALGSLFFPNYVLAKPKMTLVDKIIYTESKWNPNAYREDTGARGLMQIKPVVLKEWNIFNPSKHFEMEDLFNPYTNVNIGTWYLYKRIKEHYLPHYKLEPHLENMLASWNVGPSKHGREIGDARKNFNKLPPKAKEFIKEIKSLA